MLEWRWKPVPECPMENRIALTGHLHELKAKMKEVRQRMIPELGVAIELLKQALAD